MSEHTKTTKTFCCPYCGAQMENVGSRRGRCTRVGCEQEWLLRECRTWTPAALRSRGSSDTLCGDPCPEAPDLDSCLLPAGHGGEWHRNIPSSWHTGSSDTRLTDALLAFVDLMPYLKPSVPVEVPPPNTINRAEVERRIGAAEDLASAALAASEQTT